jgi:hypothetical protein
MKTKSIFLAATIIAAMSFTACKKELKSPGAPISTVAVSGDDGILKFNNRETFLSTIKELQQKNAAEAAAWEKGLNFKSQYSIFNEVTNQENFLEAASIRSGDMSKEHSDYYFNALKEKVIKEVKYEDGSTSYNYNIFDASVVNVINKDGFVVIDNVLYQYADNQLKSMPYTGSTNTNVLKAESATKGNVTVTDYYPIQDPKNQKTRSSYYWSRQMLNTWTYWDGSKKRATMNTDGYSNSSEYSSNTVVWKLNVTVQKKNWRGNWVPADFICFALNSSWQFQYGLSRNSDPNHCSIYYGFNQLSTVPITYSYPITYWPSINNLSVNLGEPGGTWFASWMGYDFFGDAPKVYTYSMYGSLCVGAGGQPLTITYP